MVAPVQSHLDNFTVNITLGSLPSLGLVLDFSDVLIVTTLAESTLATLDGVETLGDNASTFVTLGETGERTNVGTRTTQVASKLFAAAIHPPTVKVLAVDIAGGDTYAALATILRDRSESFHSVIVSSNVEADIATILSAFNGTGMSHPVFAGMDATDTGDTGLPDAGKASKAGLAVIDALSDGLKEQLYLTYHDANGAVSNGAADFAEICALYASTDWDERAAGGNLVLEAQPALGAVSQVLKTNLDDNNVNHALPSFGTSTYVDAGVMFSGRPVYHIFTRDWFENRLRNAVAQIKTDWAKRRLKLPMDRTGQALVLAAANAVVQNGQRADHLLSPEEAEALGKTTPFVRAETITSADLTARELRFSILQYFLEDARKITFSVFITS